MCWQMANTLLCSGCRSLACHPLGFSSHNSSPSNSFQTTIVALRIQDCSQKPWASQLPTLAAILKTAPTGSEEENASCKKKVLLQLALHSRG